MPYSQVGLHSILKLFQILMAAGDTFRAAASDQLEIWAERTGCEIVVAEKDKAKASSGRQLNYNSTMNSFCILFPLFLLCYIY